MKLTVQELETLSNCILDKMNKIADSGNFASSHFQAAVQMELNRLKKLNTKICDEISELIKPSK